MNSDTPQAVCSETSEHLCKAWAAREVRWNPDLVAAGHEIGASDPTSLCPMVIPDWKGAVRADYRAVTCVKCWARRLMDWVDSCHPYATVGYRKLSLGELVFMLYPIIIIAIKGPAVFHIFRDTFSVNTASAVKTMQQLLGCLLFLLYCPPAPPTPTCILLGILFSPHLLLGDLIHCL